MSGTGLNKTNGKGAVNTCAPRKSTTKVVQVGNGWFAGKNVKKAFYLLGARTHWDKYTRRGQSKATSCGDQMPGSLNAR